MEHSSYLLFIILNVQSYVRTNALFALTGSTVELKCMYTANAGLVQRLLWRRGTTILSENTILGNTDVRERLKITGDHSIGEYHLNISDIRQSDQATYECSISKTTKVHSQQLIVIVGPSAITIENVTPDNKIPGIEGQGMTIKCTAVGGQPAPDVKLEMLGSTSTGKQSAQQKFIPNKSNDGSTVTCLAGYEELKHYPLATSANIYLKLKPVITPFSLDTLSTEETKYFSVSCRSNESRPAASMYWFLGQQNITSNSTYLSNQESSTDKYTVTSNLRYRVDRSYNGQKLVCRASNVAGSMETFLTLDVKYAPGVTVQNKTFPQSQSSRQIYSTLDSNPTVTTCTWRHKSKYGEHIRDFSDNNQVLTLPTVPEDSTYQDTGEYVCTAENGIIGMDGQLKQTGSGYVISNAPPVITADNKDNSTQYGKFDKSTKVYVNVYSIQKYSSISWYIGNTHLVSNKYITKEEPAIVKDVFHGVEVQLDGYRITLTISDLQEQDFTNYTLRLYYSSQYVQHEVTLESAKTQTSSNATIGSVAGVLVVLLIVCAVIISFLIFKKRKGKKNTTKNTGFYENRGFQNVQIGYEYEEVVSKSDIQEKQTSKTYEALRTKETVDVYNDLENSKGLPSSKSTSKTYESLGTKDAVEMYDDLDNHKGLPSSKPSVDHYEALGTNDKPNVYEELENQKGQAEKVYVNEAF